MKLCLQRIVSSVKKREKVSHREINSSINIRGNYQYFITFTDDFSRYGHIYLMKNKFESFEKFKEFQNKVQNQLYKKIKALISRWGIFE